MKKNTVNGLTLLSGICLSCCLLNNAKAQNSQYFGTNSIVNNGTYSWDDANWSVPAGTSTGPFTSTWTAGDFARFYGVAGDTYTVTVNASESMAGLYLNAGSSAHLIISDAGNGTGSLDIAPNATLQDGFGYTQGFLTGGGTVTINAPITGTGGVEQEAGGGYLQLYGNNTYSGGTLVTSSGTFLDYNNNNSFGTGNIGFYNTTFALVENTGSSSVNIANNVQILGGTTGIDFIGNGVTWSGNWDLGGRAVNIRNNGPGSATDVTLSGVLSNTSQAVTFSGANGGTIHLKNQNTYTGKTVVGVSGDTAITLELDVANAIAQSAGLTLAGGTLKLAGFDEAIGALQLTADSTIDFGSGDPTLTFGDSSGEAWTGTLNLLNYDPNTDKIYFGTDGSGLTQDQLNEILDNGATHSWVLGSDGLLELAPVPEPSTLALSALGIFGGLRMWLRRRKA